MAKKEIAKIIKEKDMPESMAEEIGDLACKIGIMLSDLILDKPIMITTNAIGQAHAAFLAALLIDFPQHEALLIADKEGDTLKNNIKSLRNRMKLSEDDEE